jgi:hypothetical protein
MVKANGRNRFGASKLDARFLYALNMNREHVIKLAFSWLLARTIGARSFSRGLGFAVVETIL